MGKALRFNWRATHSGQTRTAFQSGYVVRFLALLLLPLFSSVAASEPRGAVCRVTNRLASSSSVGSGTLVDKLDDGREGLVLTCAHLFTEGAGDMVVAFPGGKTHGAKLVAIDHEADLAALAIANPDREAAKVSFDFKSARQVSACGFGPHGEYSCATGPVIGEASNPGQLSVMIGDAVRSGDSGGGVFDAEGNLVAVVWGESGGVTYASTGPPLRRFLDRVLGQRTAHVYSCPGGVCPRPIGGVNRTPGVAPPTPPTADLFGNGPSPRLDDLERRVAILEQESAKPPAAGPMGWGVVAATTVGGWLVGRFVKRGAGGRRAERFRD